MANWCSIFPVGATVSTSGLKTTHNNGTSLRFPCLLSFALVKSTMWFSHCLELYGCQVSLVILYFCFCIPYDYEWLCALLSTNYIHSKVMAMIFRSLCTTRYEFTFCKVGLYVVINFILSRAHVNHQNLTLD